MIKPAEMPSLASVTSAREVVINKLLAALHPDAYWPGELSASALATATAVSALAIAAHRDGCKPLDNPMITAALAWLEQTQNRDGGWGDTVDSPSNLSTSALVVAAAELACRGGANTALTAMAAKAKAYLQTEAGDKDLPDALTAIYGKDRTFAVPIMVNCALAGLIDWQRIPTLPYQLAALPQAWFRFLRLQVVSYALPALIAIGLLIERHKPTRNPLRKLLRAAVEKTVLAKLAAIQPETGGYIEAVPLTCFVAMTLLAQYGTASSVAQKCLDFIANSVRTDGSWPIDSNLSIWVTTNAIKAMTAISSDAEPQATVAIDYTALRKWVLAQQQTRPHPYTNSLPGGWAWTHLDGGVPDTDDTASAIIALLQLDDQSGQTTAAVNNAVCWLLKMQNNDGGWPTFCRGWAKLPFDCSSPDLTAHAIRALDMFCQKRDAAASDAILVSIAKAIQRAVTYLQRIQRPDGAWLPLWFGSQAMPCKSNPVIGTALVLIALAQSRYGGAALTRGIEFISRAQNSTGGWGAAAGVQSSIEESALALAALARYDARSIAVQRGAAYLVAQVEARTWCRQSPVGLYFANLWYSEKMYPVIWTLDALNQLYLAGLTSLNDPSPKPCGAPCDTRHHCDTRHG